MIKRKAVALFLHAQRFNGLLLSTAIAARERSCVLAVLRGDSGAAKNVVLRTNAKMKQKGENPFRIFSLLFLCPRRGAERVLLRFVSFVP